MQLIFGELSPGRLKRSLNTFDVRARIFTTGRAVVALAQLSVLLLTPYSALMQTVIGRNDSPSCSGIRNASVYCLTAQLSTTLPTIAMSIILVAVALGVYPVVTSVLHAWVAFSIATTIALPDGGDQAAAVFSLLLIAVSFADNRRWIRSRPTFEVAMWRRQIGLAGLMTVRAQVALLYFTSGISKLSSTSWANGTEEYYVARDPYFGASGPVGTVLVWATQSSLVTVSLTWGSILIEVAIATLILCGPRARRFALILAIGLHSFIVVTIGLWSFGLIMIGVVAMASTDTGRSQPPRVPSRIRRRFHSPEGIVPRTPL